MPGRAPAEAGAADTGFGAPQNSMTHARKALSVSRWPDRATRIRALYRTQELAPGMSSKDHFRWQRGNDSNLRPLVYELDSIGAQHFS